jgi:DNA-directed RNA polymerase
VQEPVSKNRQWDVLSLYCAKQKHYNPWANEWDCCNEFKHGATLDNDLEDVITFHRAENDLLPVIYASPLSSPSLYPYNTLDCENSQTHSDSHISSH